MKIFSCLRRIGAAWFIILLGLLLPLTARAGWIEVQTENFILQGEMKQKDAERLLKDLELFRTHIFSLLRKPVVPEESKIYVYGFKGRRMKMLTGSSTVAGIYNFSEANGASFAINITQGVGPKSVGRRIALHEFVHHLMLRHSTVKYPRWYREGYADYLATFVAQGDEFRVGRANTHYTRVLISETWMPLETLLSGVKNYPFDAQGHTFKSRRDSAKFYAQSWLLTHYIQSMDGGAEKLETYRTALERGEDSAAAFFAAFETTPKDLKTTLYRYLRKNAFKVITYRNLQTWEKPTFTMRRIKSGERDVVFYQALLKYSTFRKAVKKREAETDNAP